MNKNGRDLRDRIVSMGMLKWVRKNEYVLVCPKCFFDDIQGFLEKLSSYGISIKHEPSAFENGFAFWFTFSDKAFFMAFPKRRDIIRMALKHRKELTNIFKPVGGYLFTDEYWHDMKRKCGNGN